MANQSYSLVCHLLILLAFSNIIIPSISSVKRQEKPGRTDKHEDYGGASRDFKHILRKDYLRNYSSPPPRYGSRIYSVLSFGAAGDGASDDSKALVSAWKAACKVSKATIEIPTGYNFLIKPVTLQGPCMPHLILQIDGTLLAPSSTSAWPKYNLLQWLNFKWLHDFTIQGSGTLDGQGSQLRNTSQFHQSPKAKPETRPTVIRFYKSYNITVRNIRIVNSPQCHLKFDSSRGIKVKSLTISSSQDSPNTDGIHLQNTRDVEIKNSNIGCDDCVSIQTGCSNIHIHNVNCNPGHGISLGGLGRSNSLACVSDVSVDNINVQNALSGVRIKTWQGGVGSVRNVTFSNVKVSNVEIPIVIDQYYCNKKSCKNKTDAVAISDITYKGISGTYSFQPMHLACSDSTPCSGLNLINVKLSPENNSQALQKPFCWKSYGKAYGLFDPSSVGCLQRNDRLSKTLTKSHNNTC
ncbi:polygalacturonase At1g48100-like isoform X2 [Ananas comosus]|uniref:Polygalacturonase At1g48100-like isoform X2 n=1 Tax=Ananas comosus TaxID=4615 RepID=A0A6P5G0A5_ANACO|nr:polygalacturonase At1g48100-like isoform X2 [Ananas comosus]